MPCWNSRMEASLRRGASSSSMCGAQARAAARWSPFLSSSLADLVCIPLGCLAPPLRLNLVGRLGPPSFYHFLALVFLLPIMINRISSEGLGGWKSGKPGLGCLPRCMSPRLGFQQFLKGRPLLTLYPHFV